MLFKLLSFSNCDAKNIAVVSLLPAGYYSSMIESLGIKILHLDIKKKPILSVIRYIKFSRNFCPEITQSWMYHANVFAVLFKLPARTSKIVFNVRKSLTNIKSNKIFTRFLIHINARLSNFSDAVVNNSRQSQVQHNKLGFKAVKDIWIPNGFDDKTFFPRSDRKEILKKLNIPNSSKVCGMFARYHHMKNQKGFIKVASILNQQSDHNWFFILAGTDCDNTNLELTTLINQYGMADKFKLLGPIKTYKYYSALDVYLSTSIEEGFPNVVGEAMFSGITPVVTNVGGCQSLVSHYGIVEESEDYYSLAKSCDETLSLPAHKKQEMVSYVVEKYSISKIYDDYQDLYRQLIVKGSL